MTNPAGFKTFVDDVIIPASEINGYLMQGILVFADASARDTALSGSLAEGRFCYLKDTNATYYYSGSAWVAVGGSTPATVTGTTGSPSTTTVGSTTVYKFTGNGSVTTTAGTARVVVVGGGAGGILGKGAGGGGFVIDCIVSLTAATHTITVGAGSAAESAVGSRAGESSVGAFALASGGFCANNGGAIAGHSQYDGVWASGGAGGSRAAASGATGGAGLTSTVGDGSTGVEYGRGGNYNANVASPANTGRGGDAAAGTSQTGGDGVVFVVIG